ncbi:Hypothetical predicted protein [Octopus vulgaris]|uniref:Transmembrane protein n=1 Tax=Octopus vulgaris TaxID=6645 RepID=A0AA36BUK2_OCTVU|nr:Hypothetical predicted protein [Octopus vulgaris]
MSKKKKKKNSNMSSFKFTIIYFFIFVSGEEQQPSVAILHLCNCLSLFAFLLSFYFPLASVSRLSLMVAPLILNFFFFKLLLQLFGSQSILTESNYDHRHTNHDHLPG